MLDFKCNFKRRGESTMRLLALFLSIFMVKSFVYADQIKSQYDFETTFTSIKSQIQQRNIDIFAEIDHAQNAKKVGETLQPTKVIIFGNPKVGTQLMQENQAIGMELPLKIIVWQDAQNNVFIQHTNIKALAKQYRIKNTKVINNMDKLLQEIIKPSLTKK